MRGVAARPNPAPTDGGFQVIFFARADYLIIWRSCLPIGTVTDLALAMKEHRAVHRIAGLALVQRGMAVLRKSAHPQSSHGGRAAGAFGRDRSGDVPLRLSYRDPLRLGTSTPPLLTLAVRRP